MPYLTLELTYDLANTTKANYTLPDSVDPNGDKYEIVVWLSDTDLMTYDEDKQDIEFDVQHMRLGTYEIIIDLVDEYFARNRYEIEVSIIDSDAPIFEFVMPEEEKEEEVLWEPEWN